MIAPIIAGSVVAYLAIGVMYARSQVVNCWRRASEEWNYTDMVRESVMFMVAWRVLLWPWGVLFDAVRGPVARWFMHPVNSRRDRAQQLREDAQLWREKRREGSESERAMADELARLCDQMAREVDL